MKDPSDDSDWLDGQKPTEWSLIARAGAGDEDAMDQLINRYYVPLRKYFHAVVGLRGGSAEALFHDFLIQKFLHKTLLQRGDPNRGKFRCLLKKSVRCFVVDKTVPSKARPVAGSEDRDLRIDAHDSESGLPVALIDPNDPTEIAMDIEWSHTLFQRAVDLLGKECEHIQKGLLFAYLIRRILGTERAPSPAETAVKCGLSESNVRVAQHRLKSRFGEILRQEVLQTVKDPKECEAELKLLLKLFVKSGGPNSLKLPHLPADPT